MRKLRKFVEVFFKEDISKGRYNSYDALSEGLCQIAGLEDFNRMGEFGSGCSAMDIFPADEAERIAEKFRNAVGRRIAGATITRVSLTEVTG